MFDPKERKENGNFLTADALFISKAPDIVSDLLSKLQIAKGALEFYATTGEFYHSRGDDLYEKKNDYQAIGTMARGALKRIV
jgi:hypothetical protein